MIIAMLAEKPEISIPNKLSYAELQILANSIFQLRLRKIAARKLSESITVKPGEQVKIAFKNGAEITLSRKWFWMRIGKIDNKNIHS